tara:strand:+ start:541 stop:1275 length:735 start_codon:yes stop_codon:yes gene_type:complete
MSFHPEEKKHQQCMDELEKLFITDKPVELKGKWYLQVVDRVNLFRYHYGMAYAIDTEILADDGKRVLMVAYVKDNDGRVVGKGHAEEIRNAGPVNRTSAIENCETSAIGRALSSIGLAGNEYASAFEMGNIDSKEKAVTSQEKAKASQDLANHKKHAAEKAKPDHSGMAKQKVADDEEKNMILTVHKFLTVSVEGTDDLKTMRNNWKVNKEALHIMQKKYPDIYADLEKAFIEKSNKLKEKENG